MLESDCKPLSPLVPWLTSPGFCFHNCCGNTFASSLCQRRLSNLILLKNTFASSLCQRRLSNLILAPLMLESDCKPLSPLVPWLTSPGFCFHNCCPKQTLFSLMQNSSSSWIFIRTSYAGRVHDLL